MARAYLAFLERLVRSIVATQPFRFEVEALAAALLERGMLGGEEVRDVRRTAREGRFSMVEIKTPKLVIGKRGHNVGYAWSRGMVLDRPMLPPQPMSSVMWCGLPGVSYREPKRWRHPRRPHT